MIYLTLLDHLKGEGTEITIIFKNRSMNFLTTLLLCSALYVLYRTNPQILNLGVLNKQPSKVPKVGCVGNSKTCDSSNLFKERDPSENQVLGVIESMTNIFWSVETPDDFSFPKLTQMQ